MSILLDALKKSETQRQLGKTPTIHTAVEAPVAERGAEQQWIILSLVALSAVAIAWFGWQQFRRPVDPLAQAGVDVLAISQVAESPATVEQPKPRGKNTAAPASLWDVKKDVAGVTLLPAKSPREATKRKERLSQSFNAYQAEEDTATDQVTELSPTTTAGASSDPATAQPATIQPPAAEQARAATPARRSSRLQPHQGEPISFWQIPQALRDGLPEFRINVLVYAEKPADRFLLINGQRLVEKEELIDGVVLDEIRRDGAVFRYRNYRFLVKG